MSSVPCNNWIRSEDSFGIISVDILPGNRATPGRRSTKWSVSNYLVGGFILRDLGMGRRSQEFRGNPGEDGSQWK